MNAVKPIPAGYHALTPHLKIRGVAEAMEFYKKAFGAKEVLALRQPGGTLVMHGEMTIGDSYLMLSDENPAWGCLSPLSLGGTGSSIHVYVDDVDAVYSRAVEAGAKGMMPPANMFWGDRYAKVTDPFGHEWAIATHVEDVPPEEIGPRAAEAMAKYAVGA
jgi:uncharacterized glyoxalase superfamily protein PhnB